MHPSWTALTLINWETMNSGWESDVHKFTAEWSGPDGRHREDLVLRIYPGNDAYEKSAHEYESLKFLWKSGYPVPRVDLLERENSPFGKPFIIMEQIKGHGFWHDMFHGSQEEQQKLLTLFCKLFTRLHTLDYRAALPESVPLDAANAPSIVSRQIDRWQGIISNLPVTGFQANWDWLLSRQNEVAPRDASIVHWDFHPENILLKEDGTAIVIDWTGFDITDPRFDLAWTLLLIGANEGTQWREPILREYERQAGFKVTDLEFFDVAVCLRRLVSVIVSVRYGPEKLGMRPGAEQIMRSQAAALRNVYELLLQRTGLPILEVEQFLDENREDC